MCSELTVDLGHAVVPGELALGSDERLDYREVADPVSVSLEVREGLKELAFVHPLSSVDELPAVEVDPGEVVSAKICLLTEPLGDRSNAFSSLFDDLGSVIVLVARDSEVGKGNGVEDERDHGAISLFLGSSA